MKEKEMNERVNKTKESIIKELTDIFPFDAPFIEHVYDRLQDEVKTRDVLRFAVAMGFGT